MYAKSARKYVFRRESSERSASRGSAHDPLSLITIITRVAADSCRALNLLVEGRPLIILETKKLFKNVQKLHFFKIVNFKF